MANGFVNSFAEGLELAPTLATNNRERRRRRAEIAREAAAFNALSEGDLGRVAALDPQLARQGQAFQGTQQESEVAEQDRRRATALRLARAGETAVQSGADPLQTFDKLASSAGDLFGSDEDFQATRALVEEFGPGAFTMIRQGLTDTKIEGLPSSVEEFQFFDALSPEDQERFMRLQRAGRVVSEGGRVIEVAPSGVERTIQTPSETAAGDRIVEEAKKRGATVGESVIKDLDTRFGEALDAQGILEKSVRARQLLGDGVITGSGADLRLTLSRLGSLLTGQEISPEATNTAEFIGIVNGFVGQAIQAFGAGTGLSDADREFAKAMAAGDLTAGTKALQRILDIVEREAERKIENYEKRRSTVVKRDVDVGELYPSFEPEEEPEDGVISLEDFLAGGQ